MLNASPHTGSLWEKDGFPTGDADEITHSDRQTALFLTAPIQHSQVKEDLHQMGIYHFWNTNYAL